jgi:hypothetical protein
MSWPKPGQFLCHLEDYFYAFDLYDERGREIYDLDIAVAAAEEQFGSDGWEVYNGNEGVNRFKSEVAA